MTMFEYRRNSERRRPYATFTANPGRQEREMTRAAENRIGSKQRLARVPAQSAPAILPDPHHG